MPRCKLCNGLYATGQLRYRICEWCRAEAALRKARRREKRRRQQAKAAHR